MLKRRKEIDSFKNHLLWYAKTKPTVSSAKRQIVSPMQTGSLAISPRSFRKCRRKSTHPSVPVKK